MQAIEPDGAARRVGAVVVFGAEIGARAIVERLARGPLMLLPTLALLAIVARAASPGWATLARRRAAGAAAMAIGTGGFHWQPV
jgi:hypothetical protein